MIRYRCPHCAALIVAHERRVGQSSVCKACVKPHPIPTDQALWLNERGEPHHPSAPVPVEPPPAPVPTVSIEHVSAAPAPAPVPEPAPPAIVALDLSVPLQSASHESSPAPSASELQLPEPPVEPVRVEPPAPVPVPAVVIVREPDPAPTAPDFGRAAAPVPLQSRLATLVSPVERADDSTPQPAPGVVTLTPPPAPAPEPSVGRSRPLPVPVEPARRSAGRFAPAPVPQVPETERVEPVQLQTQADIAVALTAALTSRMKPPATPRRDLRPSTAAWMLLTAVGVSFAGLALFSDAAYRWVVYVVGAVQIGIGYFWIVKLTQLRDPNRGLWCAIPPVSLYYLAQYKYAKFRPLRFVATGTALVLLALATTSLTTHTHALVRRSDPPVVQQDPATMPKLGQLRTYRDQRSYDALSKVLDVLAKTDPLLSEDAKDRAELSAELKALCDHSDTGVKVRAMAAYARWDPTGARAVCLAAVRSPSADEREWALRLLPQWKDADSARAVQSLIGRPGTVETNRAKAALEEIGGAAAQDAAIALLNRAEDQSTKLTALSVLEKVGGAETASWLRTVYAVKVPDAGVRDRALAASDAIEARLRLPSPAPMSP